MGLIDVLAPERILIDPPHETREDLLRLLVQRVCLDLREKHIEEAEVLRLVLEREEQMSTGLQEGIAIPHGMLPFPVETTAALAIVPRGVDFACLDKEPARFVTLLVFQDSAEGRAQHVSLLAETVGHLTSRPLREGLLAAPDPARAWQCLSSFATG